VASPSVWGYHRADEDSWWWRRRSAPPVLKEAQSIDARESGMDPFVREFKSLQDAIKEFNRF
jgi:hypothetical protein